LDKRKVLYKDLGVINYKTAWDYQEELLQANVKVKTLIRNGQSESNSDTTINATKNHFLIEAELAENNIEFFNTNRGGDITFHGFGQIVGYPILDLEKYYTDIGKYLRNLEEVIILTIAEYGIKGERSSGETGVWIEPGVVGKERKICAIGVRCSRWITMHGFALNVNTNLSYFNNIIPCGIQNKQVTSIEKELGTTVDYEEAKEKVKRNFEKVFESDLF
jgi:lipoyl(octanoyl) transferase